jgi:hypothetical protein
LIAALFVRDGGPCFGVEGIDPWSERRDEMDREFPNKTNLCKSWVIRSESGPIRETYCEVTARLLFNAGHDVVLVSAHLANLNSQGETK